MTLLEAYVLFGLPLIAIGIGVGLFWLDRWENRKTSAK